MNKEQLLEQVKTLARADKLSKGELIEAFERGKAGPSGPLKKLKIVEILYYLGGAIVFVGIVVLIVQNWDRLDALSRILSTLGSGLACYFFGAFLSRKEDLKKVGLAFFLISLLVLPVGLGVVLNEAGIDSAGAGWQSIMAVVFLGLGLLSYFVFKQELFIIFSVFYATWLFFAITARFGERGLFDEEKFVAYRILIAGLAYMFLGRFFQQKTKRAIANFLYGFGVFGFLGSALWLGGWGSGKNVFWELIFPALVFGVIFLSVHLKARAFLTFGVIFLMLYIIKITAEYFTNSLGWPLSLVLAGLCLIAIGYGAFRVNKQYLSETAASKPPKPGP